MQLGTRRIKMHLVTVIRILKNGLLKLVKCKLDVFFSEEWTAQTAHSSM